MLFSFTALIKEGFGFGRAFGAGICSGVEVFFTSSLA